jgi:hypothetical protein
VIAWPVLSVSGVTVACTVGCTEGDSSPGVAVAVTAAGGEAVSAGSLAELSSVSGKDAGVTPPFVGRPDSCERDAMAVVAGSAVVCDVSTAGSGVDVAGGMLAAV